jgi:hypothetical protein
VKEVPRGRYLQLLGRALVLPVPAPFSARPDGCTSYDEG